MSERGFSPPSHHPIPLTREKLREMQRKFAETSKRLENIKELEETHPEDIDHPEWI
ncbi:MAG: hypothetical protein WC753_03225 [Candidatus Gracilibacteria bacterium]|jgi:hypothetical protein